MVDSRRPAAPADGVAGPVSALSAERYLAWLYSPPAMQPVLAALCRIESEVVASLKPGVDHHVAHTRLQWWREECERTAEGRAVHPLTRELLASSRDGAAPSPLAGLSGFVDTAVWDLAGATFETRKELVAYCERWATAMFVTAASAADGAASAAHLRALGAAVREVELLAGLAREAQSGRLRVPLDELERAGVDTGSLAKAPWPASLATLLRERHAALRATIADAASQFSRDEQASVRGLLVWAALAWRLSWRAQRALPNVILQRRYHALSDGWHAWRAAHRATAGKLWLH
jgi:15-cis-phytoene synthase